MGQNHSATENSSQPLKNLKIQFEITTYNLAMVDRNTTVSGLVKILNNEFPGLDFPIVSLKTVKGIEILDYWLSLPERKLTPLQPDEELIPVFYSPVPLKIGLSTFEVIKVIGKGTYATVTQVRKKDTGIIYAMKSTNKESFVQNGLISHLLTEKEILSSVNSPFIAKMHWSFQTSHKVHFILDFYPGGEFFYHLRKIRHFTEVQSKFYFAEILLGIKALHKKEFAYRDLKPENIVIDIDGHIRLTDFGLSRQGIDEISMSFCGSPEYMCPEMLKGNGHNKMVDFYCLGTILYEMLTEFPPFYNRNIAKMYESILNQELSLPEYLSFEAKSILGQLLDKDPMTRLGANGVEEIMEHPWCKDIPWSDIKKKKTIPPFFPSLHSTNFDVGLTSLNVNTLEFSDTEAENDDFRGIDYNLITKSDCISKQYFENTTKSKISHSRFSLGSRLSNSRDSLNRSPETISPFSTRVSPMLSPLNSLNSSYISEKNFTFIEARKKELQKTSPNTLMVPQEDLQVFSKNSFENVKEERKSLVNTLRISLQALISKIKD